MFGKLPYEQFYSFTCSRFKKQDFIVRKDAAFPYTAEAIWKVENIAESYWLCKDNVYGGKPKPIVARDRNNITGYFNPNDVIVVNELDEELKF